METGPGNLIRKRSFLPSTAVIMVSVLIILATSAVSVGQVESESLFCCEVSEQIENLFTPDADRLEPAFGVSMRLTHELAPVFYRERDFRPLWLKDGDLTPAAWQLIERLRAAAEHGLCSDAYLLDELEGLLNLHQNLSLQKFLLTPFNQAILDVFLTQAFFAYATHMIEGQVDPNLAHVDWRARRRKADLSKLLTYAIDHDRLEQTLAGLVPPHAGYLALKSALADYRKIAAMGGWTAVPEGPTLRPGDLDERVPLLRERLVMTADLDEGDPEHDFLYGSNEQKAVRLFQARHGLVVDGVVGRQTLEQLNVPVEQRIRTMELNLERWRWLPKSLGKRNIQVNIADFSLSVMEQGVPVIEMPVVVGTSYRKTPVFSARMTYLEMAPTWTVPPTILREDKLPAIKADPGYLARKHFRVLQRQDGEWVELDASGIDWSLTNEQNFPGILRQDPGPWNPLGRVKFMFPNSFNVYLHDTNEPRLFAFARRSYSSGCIRIERPVELAHYLLKDVEPWDNWKVDIALQGTTTTRAEIPAIPVHILYWTAWVDHSGIVQFRPDIYLRDLDLEVALSDPAYQVEPHLNVAGVRMLE